MELEKAKEIAEKYVEILKPYCERIQIAGSIRREKPDVKDVEIVCIPQDLWGFCTEVKKLHKIKGEPSGKYTQRRLIEGINLDLFMAKKENWGLIFAMRTGSAHYSHQVLAIGWVKKNCHSKDGKLRDENGREIILREEEHLFDFIGIPYCEPSKRL